MEDLHLLKSEFEDKLELEFAPGIKAGFPSPADDGDIVVGYVNEEFTIKYLDLSHKADGYIELRPANKRYQPIRINADDDFEIWGVVVWTIKNWKR